MTLIYSFIRLEYDLKFVVDYVTFRTWWDAICNLLIISGVKQLISPLLRAITTYVIIELCRYYKWLLTNDILPCVLTLETSEYRVIKVTNSINSKLET